MRIPNARKAPNNCTDPETKVDDSNSQVPLANVEVQDEDMDEGEPVIDDSDGGNNEEVEVQYVPEDPSAGSTIISRIPGDQDDAQDQAGLDGLEQLGYNVLS